MNNQRIIVPDVHDRVEQLGKLDAMSNIAHLPRIYLGDWTDAVKSTEERRRQIVEYLNREIAKPDNTFLWGNHDWHYSPMGKVHPTGIVGHTSGYRESTYELWQKLLPAKWWERFQFYHEYGGWLMSHAGWNVNPKYDVVNELSWPWQVGRARGGTHVSGGPLWCDWDREFRGGYVNQIVGHSTSRNGVRIKHGSINLDTLLQYVAHVDGDGMVTIVKVE